MHGLTYSVGTARDSGVVRQVEFALMSDDEILAQSVVEVTNNVMYTRGVPSVGGVNDLRMGTTDRKLRCGTCGNAVDRCPGHMGHISLPVPVYHGMYIDTVLKVLRTLCFWCSRPRRDAWAAPVTDGTRVPATERFATAYSECRGASCCEHCAGPQPEYRRLGNGIVAEWMSVYGGASLASLLEDEEERQMVLRPFDVRVAREILEACSDADWNAIGFNADMSRPEAMVPRTIVVPPPCIRPSVLNDARSRGQDDLTHMLQSILKRSNSLRASLGARPEASLRATVLVGSSVTGSAAMGQRAAPMRDEPRGVPNLHVPSLVGGDDGDSDRGNVDRRDTAPDEGEGADDVDDADDAEDADDADEDNEGDDADDADDADEDNEGDGMEEGDDADDEDCDTEDRAGEQGSGAVGGVELDDDDAVATRRSASTKARGTVSEAQASSTTSVAHASNRATSPITPDELWARLQSDVCALCNNTSRARGQTLQRSGAPTRTIKHRLCGKHGRLRENMMGKRTNQSARSVVSPDPTLDVDEIGIPPIIASTLTVPERVTNANIRALVHRIRLGAGRVDGAATVITADDAVIDLEMCPEERRAQLRLVPASPGRKGDVVERYLQDGDVVVFNRQPSLHKFGMMGHRVRIIEGMTLRLSELAAPPYNADFDGDEMNVHVPQGPSARAEVSELMMVSQLIISPQGNRPVVGLVQDSLLGAHLMTDPACRLSAARAAELLAHVRDPAAYPLPAPSFPRDRSMPYHGRDVVSALLPPIDMHRPPSTEGTEPVIIRAGRLVSGQLSKATIGSGSGGIIQIICQDFGSERAARFLSDVQSVIMRFLAIEGFSIGIGACLLPSAEDRERVRSEVSACAGAAESIIDEADGYASVGMADEAEAAVVRVASSAITRVGKCVSGALARTNPLLRMITAGSKGNPVNYTQIMGCVGQNCVEGGRIAVGQRLTLPRFAPHDHGMDAHGFVRSSYIEGLRPHELFFHAMGGREGLVDTAVKTAETGYMQRRTVKGLEEKAVAHAPHDPLQVRRPVVGAQRALVQMHYGGDNCDASRLERVPLPGVTDTDSELVAWAGGVGPCADALLAARAELVGMRSAVIGVSVSPHAHVPCSLDRILYTVEREAPASRRAERADSSESLRALVDMACEAVRRLLTRGGAAAMVYLLRYWMCVHSLRRRGVDVVERVHRVAEAVRTACVRALVSPGEMVGIVTAQMIGEPLTQMTLNTFHLAGVGHQTGGIARIKELIDVTRNPKTPIVTICPHPAIRNDPGAVQAYAERLPRLTLGTVVSRTDILNRDGLDPPERAVLDVARACAHPGDPQHDSGSGLILRMLLGADVMATWALTPEDIVGAVRGSCPGSAAVAAVGRALLVDPGPVAVAAGTQVEFARRLSKKLQCDIVLQGEASVTRTTVRRIAGSAMGDGIADTMVIEAHGAKLAHAMGLPLCDWTRTYTTDVTDVLSTLGIEAARAVLARELVSTISFDGTYVNDRHVQLLVDSMCARGIVAPMSRHGINKSGEHEVMKQCSYEETLEVLSRAALIGERDAMGGVTPCVAFGRRCTAMGTAVSHPLRMPTVGDGGMSHGPHARKTRQSPPRWKRSVTTGRSDASHPDKRCGPKRRRLVCSTMTRYAREIHTDDVSNIRADQPDTNDIMPATKPPSTARQTGSAAASSMAAAHVYPPAPEPRATGATKLTRWYVPPSPRQNLAADPV